MAPAPNGCLVIIVGMDLGTCDHCSHQFYTADSLINFCYVVCLPEFIALFEFGEQSMGVGITYVYPNVKSGGFFDQKYARFRTVIYWFCR